MLFTRGVLWNATQILIEHLNEYIPEQSCVEGLENGR
jgi:hypothetical protein